MAPDPQLTSAQEIFSQPVITMPRADIMPGKQIEWIDDRRIVFIGFPKKKDNRKSSSVFRWDTPHQVDQIFDDARKLCFDGEDVFVLGKSDKKELRRFRIAGPSYSDAILLENPSSPDGRTYTDDQQCLEKSIPNGLLGHNWVSLHERHGYLDFGLRQESKEAIQVALVNADGKTRRDTNLVLTKSIMPNVFPAPLARGNYFIHDLNITPEERQQWRETGFIDAWILQDNAHVVTIKVPSGPWASNAGTILILPLQKGLVIVAQGFERDGTPGSAGVYRVLPDGQSAQLVSGFVDQPRISPNGCRLAFAFQQRFDTLHSLKQLFVMDLCD